MTKMFNYKQMRRTLNISLFLIFIISSSIQSQQTLSLELTEKKLPFGQTTTVPKSFPNITLVLSGGGSRGLAQIGIIEALTEKGIPIETIVGTSMGSLIGGLYAAGYSITEIDSIVRALPWDDFFTPRESKRYELFVDQKLTEDRAIVSLRLDGLNPILPTSINTGQKVSNLLSLLSLNAPVHVRKNFSELLTNFYAVSTDLVSGKLYVWSEGSLSQAMRSSSSISLLMPPVEKDSMLLVDGGLITNIPVKTAKNLGGDFIIACNTTSPLKSREELRYPWNIADQMVSIPMKALNESDLNSADIVLKPELGQHANSDFSGIDNLIEAGKRVGRAYADKILADVRRLVKEKISTDSTVFRNTNFSSNNKEIEEHFREKFGGQKIIYACDILSEFSNLIREGGIKNISAKIDSTNGENIFINVERNRIVRSVSLTGIESIPQNEISKLSNKLLQKPYNGNAVVRFLVNVLKLYRKRGMSLASVENVDFDHESGKLNVSIIEGLIHSIKVEGNEKTNQDVILRELPFSEGEIFTYQDIERGLANLRSTNLFENIQLDLNRVNSAYEVVLKVTERISQIIRLGLRIDNENQTQALIDIRDENLFGTGTELGFIYNGGLRNGSFILEHRSYRIFNTYLTYKIRGYHEFQDINQYSNINTFDERRFERKKIAEYRQSKTGVSFGAGTQVRKTGNLFAEFKYQQDQIQSNFDYSGDIYKTTIALLRFSLLIDSQNRYPYPTNGVLFNLSYETAQKSLGSDISFTKSQFIYRNYTEIAGDHNISLNFNIGFADQTLPLSEQFSFGGQSQFYGYRDYEYRGRQILSSSLEYRYKLPVKLFFDSYVKLRYDLGSIWEEREQIRFRDLRHGIGAAISLDTPLGPADFSIGKSFLVKGGVNHGIITWSPTYFYFTIGYYY